MRTIAVLLIVIAERLKDYPADKDRSVNVSYGELKQITDAARPEIEKLPDDDKRKEPFAAYSAAAAEHSADLQATVSARKLAALIALCPSEPPNVPAEPPKVPSEPPKVPSEPPKVPSEPPKVPFEPPKNTPKN